MSAPDDGTKSRILDAAGAVFAEHGFDRATIREISSQAEVNLAAVNYHFGDKERLYKAVIRHAHELAIAQVPLPNWDDSTLPSRKLRDFIENMLQRMLVMQRLPWQSRLMMREFLQPRSACLELVEDYIRPHFRLLVSIVGQIMPPGTPEDRLYKAAFSVVGQCLFYKMNGPVVDLLLPDDAVKQHFQIESLAAHIYEFTLRALTAGSDTP